MEACFREQPKGMSLNHRDKGTPDPLEGKKISYNNMKQVFVLLNELKEKISDFLCEIREHQTDLLGMIS